MVQLNGERTAAVSSQEAAGDAAAKIVKRAVPTIEVDAILFRAANEFTSDEDARYYLQGVYVQPHPEKGALLTATDGYRLICIHDENGQCSEAAIVVVEGKAFNGVKVNKKKPDERPRLKLDAAGHVVLGTYRSLESAIIDATYPDYARVLKPVVKSLKKGIFGAASLRHEYLVGFSRVAALISSLTAIRLISTGESEPAVILFDGAPHAFGILMPMRTAIQNGMPAFMRSVLEPPPVPVAPPAAAKPKPKKKPAPKAAARPKARNLRRK